MGKMVRTEIFSCLYFKVTKMSLTWPVKDPNAVLDYFLDWTSWLTTGDTIDSIVWTVPSGLTLETQTISGAKAYAWLSEKFELANF